MHEYYIRESGIYFEFSEHHFVIKGSYKDVLQMALAGIFQLLWLSDETRRLTMGEGWN